MWSFFKKDYFTDIFVAGIPASRPMGKIPEGLLRPMHFENPLLPATLRFGADPNIGGFDPLAVHRKMGPRPPLGPIPPSPNLYEMAALTSELDTHAITSKVKEVLLANNVGQKVLKQICFIAVEMKKI